MSMFPPIFTTKLNTQVRKHALLALATIAAACLCVPSAGASVARSSITPISSISVGGSQSTSRTATTGRNALPAGRGGSSGGSSGRSSSGSSSRRSSSSSGSDSSSRRSSSSGSGSSSRRSSSGGSNSSGSGSSSRRNSWWGRSNSRSGSSNYYNRYYNNYDSDQSYDDPNNDTYEDPSYDDSTSDNSYSSQSYDNSGYSQEQQDMDSRFIPLAVIMLVIAGIGMLGMIAAAQKPKATVGKPQPRFNASPMSWLSGSDGVSNYYDISDDNTSYDSNEDNSYDCDSGDYDYSDDNSYDSDTSDNSYYDC